MDLWAFRRISLRKSLRGTPNVLLIAFLLVTGSFIRVKAGTTKKTAPKAVASVEKLATINGRQPKTDQPASSRQVAPLFRLPNPQLDSTYNPIELFWGWGLLFYYLLPGLAAIILGFIYPFYEYLRTGHTYYHPGLLFDKDFTEYTTWYFKHKIYKKKYWNLDAYLYHYFDSHTDNLENFFHEIDVPLSQLVSAGFKEQAEAPTGKGVSLNATAEAAVAGNATMGDVLGGLINDMIERSPDIKTYVEKDIEGKGYEKLKKTLKDVILEQFAAKKTAVENGIVTAAAETTTDAPKLLKASKSQHSGEEPTAYAAYYGGAHHDKDIDALLNQADAQSNAIADSRSLFRSRMGQTQHSDLQTIGKTQHGDDPWVSAINGRASGHQSISM